MTMTTKEILKPALGKAARKSLERRLKEIRRMLRGPCTDDPDLLKERNEIEEALGR